MSLKQSAASRTEVGPVQTAAAGPDQTAVPTYPNARLIHLPVHASWLNQIEIYFSIVQRKALTPNDFATLPALARHLMDFAQHYRTIARPFEWTFTHAKLDAVIEKITRHKPQPLALAA
jgi:uncharacterized protein YdaL